MGAVHVQWGRVALHCVSACDTVGMGGVEIVVQE